MRFLFLFETNLIVIQAGNVLGITLQLGMVEGVFPVALCICLFMSTKASWWFISQSEWDTFRRGWAAPMWDGFCSHLCSSLSSPEQLCLSFPVYISWYITVSSFTAENPPWNGGRLQAKKKYPELYLHFFRWLSPNPFLRWGKSLDVRLVSELKAALPSLLSSSLWAVRGCALCLLK